VWCRIQMVRPWQRIWSDRRGVVLIELALTISLLILLILPVVDLGRGFYFKMQVMTAAEAGSQWGFQNKWQPSGSTTTNLSSPQKGICDAIKQATPLGGALDCTGSTNSGDTFLIYSANPATSDPNLVAAGFPNPTPNITLACYCVTGTGTVTTAGSGSFVPSTPTSPWTPSACTTTQPNCSSGLKPGAYVTVNTRYRYTPIFAYLGFGGPITLISTSTVRAY
jgi:hypothetical protein